MTSDKEVPREVIVKRLRKIEGQVSGLEKMLVICFRQENKIEDTAESLARVVSIWSRVHVGDKGKS